MSSVLEAWSCGPDRSSPILPPAGKGASVMKTFLFSIIFICFLLKLVRCFHSGLAGAVPNTELLPTCVAAHCCSNFLQFIGDAINLDSCFSYPKILCNLQFRMLSKASVMPNVLC